MAELERDGFGQRRVLIRHWLHEAPADDMDTFVGQAAGAEWLEQRYFESLGKLLGAETKK